MNECIFCKIIRGELPSYKVHENDKFYSFLSIAPHHEGHTLVIPKIHVDDFFNMDEDNLNQILSYAKPLQDALKKAFNPKSGKIGIVVAGMEVPHAHLHLIPMDNLYDLDFRNAKKATPEELQETLDKIKAVLN